MSGHGGWLKTRQEQITAASIALLFGVLTVFAVIGMNFANVAMFVTSGYLLGGGLAYLLAKLLSRWGWAVAFVVVVAFWFVLPFLDLLVLHPRGYGLFPDTDTALGVFARGVISGWLLGGLFGFFPSLRRPMQGEARQNRRWALQGWAIVGGALLFLFALAFGAFVLLNYVVGPLIRYFAG